MKNIVPVLRTDKINKKGLAPINIRIYSGGTVRYVSTGFSIPPEGWDEEKSRVRKTVTDHELINVELARKLEQVTGAAGAGTPGAVRMEQVRERVYGKKKVLFADYAAKILEEYRLGGKISTYDGHRTVMAKFNAYAAGRKICFQDITPDFLRGYEKYLREERLNSVNTVHKNLRFIRRVFNHALTHEVIAYADYPFRKFRLRSEKTQKTYLTQEELVRLRDTPLPENTPLCMHRDMFVFASYAGGIRISDLLQLRRENYDGHAIRFRIEKTGVQIETPVPDRAMEILEKYLSACGSGDAMIFPVIKNRRNLEDPVSRDRAISGATATVNRSLKTAAEKAGISKKISFHASRHTFSTLALRRGFGIEMVAKVLGHQSLRQVLVYAQIVDTDKEKAMKSFNF